MDAFDDAPAIKIIDVLQTGIWLLGSKTYTARLPGIPVPHEKSS